ADNEAALAAAAAALADGRPRLEARGERRIFSDVLLPPPKLVVYGAGDDARPTVSFAAAAGFRVFVVDHRPAYLNAHRVPEAMRLSRRRPEDPGVEEIPADRDTFAVVKTHSLARDTAWVKRLLATPVPYVGVLGPRSRTGKVLAAAGAPGAERV